MNFDTDSEDHSLQFLTLPLPGIGDLQLEEVDESAGLFPIDDVGWDFSFPSQHCKGEALPTTTATIEGEEQGAQSTGKPKKLRPQTNSSKYVNRRIQKEILNQKEPSRELELVAKNLENKDYILLALTLTQSHAYEASVDLGPDFHDRVLNLKDSILKDI